MRLLRHENEGLRAALQQMSRAKEDAERRAAAAAGDLAELRAANTGEKESSVESDEGEESEEEENSEEEAMPVGHAQQGVLTQHVTCNGAAPSGAVVEGGGARAGRVAQAYCMAVKTARGGMVGVVL